MRLQIQGEVCDLALFNLAIDSKLRGCDSTVLSKLPRSTASSAVSICTASAKPLPSTQTIEQPEALQPFNPDAVVLTRTGTVR